MGPVFPEKEYEGYIFDCDGTLADNMPVHYRAWRAAVRSQGGDFPEELFYEWGGTPTKLIVKQLNERNGTNLSVERTVELKEANYLEQMTDVVPYTEVVEFARSLRGRRPMVVVSGGSRRLVSRTLAQLGITDWFEAVLTSDDYDRGKPHPDPFLAGAARMGVEATHCLVTEDSPTGREAAEAAGMDCVIVPSPFERGRARQTGE